MREKPVLKNSFRTISGERAPGSAIRPEANSIRFTFYSDTPDRERQSIEAVKSSDSNPEQQTLRRGTVSLLEQAVDALPDIYRCVFVLRETENMSTNETANCLDLTEETLKVRLLRARQMLRKEFYTRAAATSSEAFRFLGTRCDQVVRRVFRSPFEIAIGIKLMKSAEI
jgi:RNA polymerase sigma-70 factor (ECF subfamily)